ncbi:MAG: TetR/AcrR family transcriptional regulator [Desulfatibacillaceae bacterium]
MPLRQTSEKKGTRTQVLQAAFRVFSRHPYNAASIRMIAKEGGFGHAIIGYYFPTKADLFRALAAEIYDDLYAANREWLAEVRSMSLEEGFSRYVGRLVEYSRDKPWVLRIMMLNLAQEKVGAIPGQDRLMEVIEGMRRAFAETMRLPADPEVVARFSDSFNALALYYLGAPDSAAWLLRMEADSTEYADWVHKTLVTMFLPVLARLFGGRGEQEDRDEGFPSATDSG